MSDEIRVWEVTADDSLREIAQTKLDLETRLAKWLRKDISILGDNLLVIGQEVETDFGGFIDLLCLDENGDGVVVELKRDKTPREITAQVLDYASWVNELGNERITEIAEKYLKESGGLEKRFKDTFGAPLPEILNEHHTMLVVGSQIDSSSERIIKYLSETYGVQINAVTFQYFRNGDGREYLGKTYFLDPSQVKHSGDTKRVSKRRANLSYEDLQKAAEDNGLGEVYRLLVEGLREHFDQIGTTRSSIAFQARRDNRINVIFSLVPTESDPEGGLKFQVYAGRFAGHFGCLKDEVSELLPEDHHEWEYQKDNSEDGWYSGFEGFFKNEQEVRTFLSKLDKMKSE